MLYNVAIPKQTNNERSDKIASVRNGWMLENARFCKAYWNVALREITEKRLQFTATRMLRNDKVLQGLLQRGCSEMLGFFVTLQLQKTSDSSAIQQGFARFLNGNVTIEIW